MQIHELNTYAGSLNDSSYLAVDNGTDTGKVTHTALMKSVNDRIDNIIAGEAPSAEEVVDARLGADGVNYPSLGDAIRDQITDLKDDTDDLREDIDKINYKLAISSNNAQDYVLTDLPDGMYMLRASLTSENFAGLPTNFYGYNGTLFVRKQNVYSTVHNSYLLFGANKLWFGFVSNSEIVWNQTDNYGQLNASLAEKYTIPTLPSGMYGYTAGLTEEQFSGLPSECYGKGGTLIVNNSLQVTSLTYDSYLIFSYNDLWSGWLVNGVIKWSKITGTDTTLSVSGKAADGKIVGDRLVDVEDKLLNLANINDLLTDKGYFINSSGARRTSANHDCSDYIKVSTGDVINYNLAGTLTTVAVLAFYSSADESAFVSAITAQDRLVPIVGAFECPSDGYIRISNRKDYPNGYCFKADKLPDSVRYELNVIGSDYPNYWDNELATSINTARANQLNKATDLIEFVHVTDVHWKANAKHSPSLINRLSKELGIGVVVANGDYIGSHDTTKTEAVNELNNFVKAFDGDIKLLPNCGNHDFNNVENTDHPEAFLSTEEVYKFLAKRASGYASTYNNSQYMYYDDTARKVRYLLFRYYFVSNMVDSGVINFVEARCLELPSDWSVVLACHGYLANMKNESTGEYEWVDEQTYEGARDLKEKLLSIKSRSSADIIMLIVGHAHRDNAKTLTDGNTSLSVVCCTTDCFEQSTVFNSWEMTKGTDTEQAFDIVQIDRTERKIYLTRVGAGDDRVISY